jgi:hypothetical protein
MNREDLRDRVIDALAYVAVSLFAAGLFGLLLGCLYGIHALCGLFR